jgi:enamine deaminase RidA (YjgF/YER057c/UK114 family)
MDFLKHVPSSISSSSSEALRIDTSTGAWTFISGVSIKTYLTDLAPYAVFSRIRGKTLSTNPPTSAAVHVARLLRHSKIEIDAITFLTAETAA